MISERTLKNWRRDALQLQMQPDPFLLHPREDITERLKKERRDMADRILKLTQELMDMHLIRKRGG